MRQRSSAQLCISALILVAGLFAGATLLSSQSAAQDASAPSLQEQLKAQYKVVKLRFAPTGISVADPGTVLDVQKGGLLGVPPQAMMACPARFQDGDLKAPTGMCPAMVKQFSRFLETGDKVYPTRIDVSLDKDRIIFQLIECDSCNGVQQPSSFKSEVIFQFAKGTLWNANVSKVEDVIGQVLANDAGGDSQQQGDQGTQGNDQGAQNQGTQNQGGAQSGNAQPSNNQGGGGGGQAQPQAPAPAPAQIEKGQSTDDVKAALGNPDKIVNLGTKQIWVYKDLKVTFLSGKVSDVQ